MFNLNKLNLQIENANATMLEFPKTDDWRNVSAQSSKYRAENMRLLATNIDAYWDMMVCAKRYTLDKDFYDNDTPQIVMAHDLGSLDLFSETCKPIEVHLINTPGAYWMEHALYFVFKVHDYYVGVSYGMRYQVETLVVAKDKKYLDRYFYRENTVWNEKGRVEWTNQQINIGDSDVSPHAVYNCVRQFLESNVKVNDGFIRWDDIDDNNVSTLEKLELMSISGWEKNLPFGLKFNYKDQK